MTERGVLLRSLTVLLTAIVLFALAGFQVTSATAGVRLLSRLSAALIEFDRWLPEHRDDLDLLARDRPTGFVRPDLPIAVSLPSRQLISASDDVHRALILNAMGSALYNDGLGAFEDAESESRPPTITNASYWAVTLLDKSAHGMWQTLLPISLVALLLCLGASILGGRSPLPALAAGAAVAALASLLVWGLSSLGNGLSSSATNREIVRVVHDGAWIGVRNSIAVLASSLALIVFFRYAGILGLPDRAGSPAEPHAHTSDISTPSDLPPY